MYRPLNADTPRKRLVPFWLLATVFALAVPSAMTAATTTKTEAGNAPAETDNTRAAVELVPMRASYSASIDKGISINGSAVRSLQQQDDGSWIYRFDVDSFLADIKESVTFRWEDGQVIPQRYRYTLEGFAIRNRSRVLEFNWPSEAISGSFDGNTFSLDTEPEALDPLGFQLQLSQDLKAGKTDMRYAVVDKGGYDYDRFAVIGEEVVDSKVGSVNTVKVEKVRGEGSKRETLMWFAPELDYLLIRLVQTEPDGTRYEVNIESADIKSS
ncbi:DUF3108 domain-containing protein [uncultured Marinobacter sp.]|uniref:DUF3108 domain-containing protein n=1 Tax=uncultured Marinobacter sp. TaxID=187379 RepID=UPI0030D757EE